MKPTLLVMAAGIGSRYGGIKQLDQFGPSGETIVDYALYDAVEVGFGKIVFVVSETIESDCRRIFGSKLAGRVEVEFMTQSLTSLAPPEFTEVTQSTQFTRTKPWGTAHAVLVARDVITEPFAVLNADDFYGRSALATIANFLCSDVTASSYAMVSYELRKTLSRYGTVSRGICEVDEQGRLRDIVEHTKIRKVDGRAESIGESEAPVPLTADEPVSMNCWGFHPSIFGHLERQFAQFLSEHGQEETSEFYIPAVVDQLIKAGVVSVQVLPTAETWFGVTYQEDVPVAKAKIQAKITEGKYPDALWSNVKVQMTNDKRIPKSQAQI